jgi:hypothetical protein
VLSIPSATTECKLLRVELVGSNRCHGEGPGAGAGAVS